MSTARSGVQVRVLPRVQGRGGACCSDGNPWQRVINIRATTSRDHLAASQSAFDGSRLSDDGDVSAS